jgi:hypothetical protein
MTISINTLTSTHINIPTNKSLSFERNSSINSKETK